VDSTGVAHIAYYDWTNRDLKYRRTDQPSSLTLDATGDVGDSPAISIDAKGSVHIAYLDATDLKVWHYKIGYGLSEVGTAKGGAQHISLATDRAGGAHVAWYSQEDGATSGLFYRNMSSGSARLLAYNANTIVSYCPYEPVGEYYYAQTGHSNAIGVDDAGTVHIAYYMGCGLWEARYMSFDPADPAMPTPRKTDGGGDAGAQVSMALDANGTPHIVHYRDWAGEVRYLRLTTPPTRIETLAFQAAPSWDDSVQVRVDETGTAHIAYVTSGRQLKYMRASKPLLVQDVATGVSNAVLGVDRQRRVHLAYIQGAAADLGYEPEQPGNLLYGRWNPESVAFEETPATIASSATYPSIALTPSGGPHLAWGSGGSMYHRDPAGTISWIDTGRGFMALDPAGVPALAYRQGVQLRYYHSASGSTIIDPNAGAPGGTGTQGFRIENAPHLSLAFDTAGRARIAYVDWNREVLKQATLGPTGATIRPVDDGLLVGMFPNLAVDPAGVSHISYLDRSFLASRHARVDGDFVFPGRLVDFVGDGFANGPRTSMDIGARFTSHFAYGTFGGPAGNSYTSLKYIHGPLSRPLLPLSESSGNASVRRSCKELYDSGESSDGVYPIDPLGPAGSGPMQVYCWMTAGGWTLVERNDFETGNDGWPGVTTRSCGSVVGGYSTCGPGCNLSKQFSLLGIPHAEVRVTAKFIRGGYWYGELCGGEVRLDGVQGWCTTRNGQAVTDSCGSSWTDDAVDVDAIRANMGSTANVAVACNVWGDPYGWFGDPNQEWCAIDDIQVWVR